MKRIDINHLDYIGETLEQLPKGVFLTATNGEKVNTMTIGWGSVGVMWNRPTFSVMVRPGRYTHELLETTQAFTVSVPLHQDLEEALTYCGSHSGRSVNKFKELGLSTFEGAKVNVPVIASAKLHFECEIIARHDLLTDGMVTENIDKFYPLNDLHTIYHGKIVACYLLEA